MVAVCRNKAGSGPGQGWSGFCHRANFHGADANDSCFYYVLWCVCLHTHIQGIYLCCVDCVTAPVLAAIFFPWGRALRWLRHVARLGCTAANAMQTGAIAPCFRRLAWQWPVVLRWFAVASPRVSAKRRRIAASGQSRPLATTAAVLRAHCRPAPQEDTHRQAIGPAASQQRRSACTTATAWPNTPAGQSPQALRSSTPALSPAGVPPLLPRLTRGWVWPPTVAASAMSMPASHHVRG
jgi:hypothetical protein